MKNSKTLTAILLAASATACLLGAVSCGESGKGGTGSTDKGETQNPTTYTVVWKNYDGTVLETDADLLYGATPEYNGGTPQRAGSAEVKYIFAGWTPTVATVTADATYTAKFTEQQIGEAVAGVIPVFSEDGKTVQYGFYPQMHVADEAVIASLTALDAPESNGWYLLGGEYYAKQTATVCNGESYKFDDQTDITNGAEYWFKCDVITWRVLGGNDGNYCLISDKLLDAQAFYTDYNNRTAGEQTVYANNYEKSAVRDWLNNTFFAAAFSLDDSYVGRTTVNNSAATTETNDNKYACASTSDKVYLPSYVDLINADYGFAAGYGETSDARACKTTDYARARGAWCNTKAAYGYNGSYWTRSPSDKYYYCAWNVNSGGVLSEYAVDGASHCVRPCISLYFAR